MAHSLPGPWRFQKSVARDPPALSTCQLDESRQNLGLDFEDATGPSDLHARDVNFEIAKTCQGSDDLALQERTNESGPILSRKLWGDASVWNRGFDLHAIVRGLCKNGQRKNEIRSVPDALAHRRELSAEPAICVGSEEAGPCRLMKIGPKPYCSKQ